MNKVRSDLDERKGRKEREMKMKIMMMVLRCAAVLIAVAAQAETGGGAFRFLDGEGDTGAVLIRANAVLVCEIIGGTGDIGARLSTLLDFYGEFSNSRY